MNLKSRVQKLKSDIPAIFLALNAQETPIPQKYLRLLQLPMPSHQLT